MNCVATIAHLPNLSVNHASLKLHDQSLSHHRTTCVTAAAAMPQSFPKDASLVVIGMRCAGKSSLASMAAKALHWKVVDEKLQFQKTTGYSVAGYIDKYGVKAYCAREVQILGSILAENQRCRIIICSSSCVETQVGRDLLQQYLSIVPIIHVMRDTNVLQTYLESKWSGNVVKILHSQEPVYLACSNLTFFNTDKPSIDTDVATSPGGIFEAVTPASSRPNSRSLSLKHVESDFIRFLGCIYGRANQEYNPVDETGSIFNYALELPFGDLKKPHIRLESLTCCADVLQIRTDTLLQDYLAKENPTQTWWEYIVDQLAFVRRHASQPMLYHAVLPSGNSAIHGPDYFDLVQLGLRVGAELITLDLTQDQTRLEAITQRKGHYTFIGWFHDPDPVKTGGWMGQNRLSWYEKALHIGCDMVHMTQPPTEPADNSLASWFAHTMSLRGSLPVSAYNTGRLGRPSQCVNRRLTIVRHADIAEHESEMVTVSQAQAALFASFFYEPLSFSVMGANVRYSLAPFLHNCAYRTYGMQHEYSINQTDVLDTMDSLVQDDHFGGLGLSAPFKTSVIPRLSCLSVEARAIGAVNTIMPIRYWKESGSPPGFDIPAQRNHAGAVKGLYGENTDWKGIQACMLRYLSPANAITSLSTALVIGAGGMARAAIYAMIRAGIRRICIYNRTHRNALDVVNHFQKLCNEEVNNDEANTLQFEYKNTVITALKTLADPWPSELRYPTVIVNCSPVPGDTITIASPNRQGSLGQEPAVSIPDAWLTSPTGGVYMELAYNSITSSSELLRICAEDNTGWVGVAGLEIFIEVASAQFEFWTGRRAPKHLMKERLGQHLQEMQE
jgi:shikimate 5-dehydrogenase/shikimate kinase